MQKTGIGTEAQIQFRHYYTSVVKQIVLYRRLGLNIDEIKKVLADCNEIESILYQRKLELEQEKIKQDFLKRIGAGTDIETLEEEINNMDSATIIIKKIQELFPSYYGKFISLNFSRYLTGKIETLEQMEAFSEIIAFFDNVSDMKIPADLQEYLDSYLEDYSGEEGEEKINQILKGKDNAICNIDEFVKNHKQILNEYTKWKQTEDYKNSQAFRLSEYMKQFCSVNGYYDVFIPAMRRLSPAYNAYYEQMLRANEEFLEKYPEYIEQQ